MVKDKIDTKKKWRLSQATNGVYKPGFQFGYSYVEGNYKDPNQRSYRDYGSHKDRALKEASLESYKKWLEGSGYTDKEIEEMHKNMDQQIESYYRKKKSSKPKNVQLKNVNVKNKQYVFIILKPLS